MTSAFGSLPNSLSSHGSEARPAFGGLSFLPLLGNARRATRFLEGPMAELEKPLGRPGLCESRKRMLDFAQPVRQTTCMTPPQRQALKARWHEIERELADLANGKVSSDTDPAIRERELIDEQDAIEFELAANKLECGMDESWQDEA
jgi:hypothetical protein